MRSILLCVDGSAYTKICTKYAIELARLMNAYVDVLYVTNLNNFELSLIADCGSSLGIQPFRELSTTLQNLEKKKFQRLEEKITRMFTEAKCNVKFKFNHRAGAIVDAFDEFKRDITGLDLVVLGKRGESSGTSKGHLGSSLERILRSCSCPCFIAPDKFRSPSKILIAYDGSDGINKAIQFVERNHFFGDCEVHLLTVNPTDDVQTQLSDAKAVLRDVAKLKNIVVAKKSGDVINEIEKYIAENSIDLLVIGAYSHSIVRHFFIGSTTLEIIRQSEIPVIVFK
ncbi:MAG: universal stress protein [Opitutales bacterium]|nr:universal stress protein [Opitutales bacterium]